VVCDLTPSLKLGLNPKLRPLLASCVGSGRGRRSRPVEWGQGGGGCESGRPESPACLSMAMLLSRGIPARHSLEADLVTFWMLVVAVGQNPPPAFPWPSCISRNPCQAGIPWHSLEADLVTFWMLVVEQLQEAAMQPSSTELKPEEPETTACTGPDDVSVVSCAFFGPLVVSP
jgi:hypothetical protein